MNCCVKDGFHAARIAEQAPCEGIGRRRSGYHQSVIDVAMVRSRSAYGTASARLELLAILTTSTRELHFRLCRKLCQTYFVRSGLINVSCRGFFESLGPAFA